VGRGFKAGELKNLGMGKFGSRKKSLEKGCCMGMRNYVCCGFGGGPEEILTRAKGYLYATNYEVIFDILLSR